MASLLMNEEELVKSIRNIKGKKVATLADELLQSTKQIQPTKQ